MTASALDRDPVALQRPRSVAADGPQLAGEIAAGERDVALHDLLGCAGGDHVAPQFARAGTQVDHVIGMADGVFVVFHHQHRITEVTQRFEGFDQPLVVALVQSDGRFIEHIEHSAQPRTDLRGQANTLSFAAGEASGIAVEREITKADGVEKLQPLHYLAAQALGNQPFAAGEFEASARRPEHGAAAAR